MSLAPPPLARPLRLALAWLLLAVSAACASWGEPSLTEVVAEEQAAWQASAVADYDLRVRCSSIWHVQTYAVKVRGGAVVAHDAACDPAPLEDGACQVEPYDPAQYTVAGLFATAAADAAHLEPQYLRLTFDPDHHIPLLIAYNNPDIYDEESACQVLNFQVAQAPPP